MDNDRHPRIRQSDTTCPRDSAANCDTALDLKQRLASVERKQGEMTNAFLLNDLGLPDFDGHRKDHLAIRKASEVMSRYKIGATEKIIGVIIIAVLGLLNTGILTKLIEVIK